TVRTGGRSDHANFAEWGTPAVHFFTGTHPDYHQPSDHASTVNYEGAVRVLDTIETLAMRLATMPERLTYSGRTAAAAAPSGPSRATFSVRLGVRPENYDGEKPGVLV